jgi:hypothetical protein
MILDKGNVIERWLISYWSVVQRTDKRLKLGSSDKDSFGDRVLANMFKL